MKKDITIVLLPLTKIQDTLLHQAKKSIDVFITIRILKCTQI